MSGYCKPHLNKTDINIVGGICTMKIEDIFMEAENGALTLEQFNQIVASKGGKFVDLSEGEYVSERKYSSEVGSLEKQIETLTESVSQRELDIEDLRVQLQEAGNDADRLAELSEQFAALQSKYEEDANAYEAQLSSQAREFAVKEYAATKEFTSPAAKKYYIEQMINSEDVDFNRKGELEGMEEFDAAFAKENDGAFKVNDPEPEPEPAQEQAPLPKFAAPTPGAQKPESKMSLSEMMKAKNENPDANF